MKKLLTLVVVMTLAFAVQAFADKTEMTAKVGDELYVCGCGEGCPCDTMSRNPGTCTCGKDLVKAKVTKVEKGKITMEGRNRPFVSIGKYACACGAGCKCDTISQNPGNCSCGKKMMEVKAKTKK
ncbi:MAG TPA: hypothetical protein VLD55_11455 [Candidatus Sulfobium mesophilum]|nr:hypothetical protein [Thermodesulfobacteriota bacterium]HSB32208.1 hypothetical protein [Candidatus Sulfobium mesophilum]